MKIKVSLYSKDNKELASFYADYGEFEKQDVNGSNGEAYLTAILEAGNGLLDIVNNHAIALEDNGQPLAVYTKTVKDDGSSQEIANTFPGLELPSLRLKDANAENDYVLLALSDVAKVKVAHLDI